MNASNYSQTIFAHPPLNTLINNILAITIAANTALYGILGIEFDSHKFLKTILLLALIANQGFVNKMHTHEQSTTAD